MKRLADFKRALTQHSRWQAFHIPSGKSLGIRQVYQVRTNGVTFRDSQGLNSVLDFPLASDYEFDLQRKECRIYWGCGDRREHILTYKKVE